MFTIPLEAGLCLLPGSSRGVTRRLRRAAFRLVRKHPEAAGWIGFLPEIPWEHRRHILDWILAGGWKHPLTEPLTSDLLHAVRELPPANWWKDDLRQFVAAVERGVRSDVLSTWVRLRAAGDVPVSLKECKGPAFRFPMSIPVLWPEEWTWFRKQAMADAWNLCSAAPACRDILLDERLERLTPQVQSWIFTIVAQCKDSHVFQAFLEMSPADQESLSDYGGLDTEIVSRLPANALLRILCLWPRFRAQERAGLLLATELFHAVPGQWAELVLEAPAAAFARIAKVRRNRQLWWESKQEIARFGEAFPDLLRKALLGRPDLLFVLGAHLIAYGRVRLRRLLRQLPAHPLFRPDPAPEALVTLDQLLCAHRELAATIPAFSTWDKHFSGEKVLAATAIRDVARQMLDGLTAIRLRYLIDYIERELALFGDAHAGLFRAGLRRGKQPMLRFLHRFRQGQDTRWEHPANRAWLAKRPAFRLETWREPLRLSLPVPGLGEVTIGVEKDPFEILRLGTYARTCLAAGACSSGNAVAVLLDVNKRVVFARNAAGRFLARQVVAVSDGDLLVCYSVYPHRPEEPLIDLFQLYVEDWAMRLGMRLAHGGDSEEALAVSPLAAPEWYDDGLWERYHKPA